MSDPKDIQVLERKVQMLKLSNRKLQSELQLAQDFCIALEKKNIEYIYHIGQFKARWLNRLEAWFVNVIGSFKVKKPNTLKVVACNPASKYSEWNKLYNTLTDDDRLKISEHILLFSDQKKFSIIVNADQGNEIQLVATLLSLKAQLYKNWELVVFGQSDMFNRLSMQTGELIKRDTRVQIVPILSEKKTNDFISGSKSVLTGHYVAFIEPGSTLSEDALYQVAAEIDCYPDARCIYSDEDIIMPDGDFVSPFFKPDWNLELFLAQNYVGGISFIKIDFITEAPQLLYDGFGTEEIYFHAFTSASRGDIRHVPSVLYHRHHAGIIPESAGWLRRSPQLIQNYFDIRDQSVQITPVSTNSGWLEVRRKLHIPEPLVTIIIPTRNRPDLLENCLVGVLEGTNYNNIHVIIIDHENDRPEATKLIERYRSDPRVSVLPYGGVFDHSDMNNRAAAIADGDVLLFLNDDIEVIEPNWLTELVSRLEHDDVGVVGARLLYPNGKIQHAGVILGFGGVAGHGHVGKESRDPGYFGRLMVASEVSALTGACMAIRRELFERVGGFSALDLQRTFNDVDLCLKVRAIGKINIFTPFATLIHHESATDGGDIMLKNYERLQREVGYMLETWGLLRTDPYYNVNLALDGVTFDLAFPPRRLRPWQVSL